MKLHIGCGTKRKDGYINIDFIEEKGVTDRVFDLTNPLDYENDSVEIIEGYHVFEHLPFSCIEQVITSWYRVLQPGGKIILEMPDFDEVLKWANENPNDNSVLASIFGSQAGPGQLHHWGWNKSRLQLLFEGVGFRNIEFPEPQDYHSKLEPCLRVEAQKGTGV